ncbi:hypothetical protein [Anaerosporomusa subterranea]|uniref:hypothetical protein n=1 Tax=Anaerosporomusa subterranea TaxID=1794912 RepID=UPI0009458EDC|nr:hypothetical protein [Anaerosporomusa subterranea]
MKYGDTSSPKWASKCCNDMEYEGMETGMDMYGMGMGMGMGMGGMDCDCPPKIDCKMEKECVKTFTCQYKLYRVCMYRLYKVCPRCGRESDYHGHRGMCPHCR